MEEGGGDGRRRVGMEEGGWRRVGVEEEGGGGGGGGWGWEEDGGGGGGWVEEGGGGGGGMHGGVGKGMYVGGRVWKYWKKGWSVGGGVAGWETEAAINLCYSHNSNTFSMPHCTSAAIISIDLTTFNQNMIGMKHYHQVW